MKRLALVAVVSLLPLAAAFTGGAPESDVLDDTIGLPERVDAAGVSVEAMFSHVAFLASEDDARMAGSQGERAAVEDLSRRFDSMGLRWEITPFDVVTFRSNGAGFSTNADSGNGYEARAFQFSGSTGGTPVEGQLVDAGIGRTEDFRVLADRGVRVEGAVALIQRGGIYFRDKARNAVAAGAAAVVFYNNAPDSIVGTLQEAPGIPVVGISGEDGEAIAARLAAGEEIQGSVLTDTEISNGTSRNLTALIGSEREPYLVVGAHIDSVDTPGANDNASGVAVMTEVARALAGVHSLPFAVRFVAFGAEEIGLHGSRNWVESRESTELRRCLGMINLDTVGSGEAIAVYTVEAFPAGPLVRAATSAARRVDVPTVGVVADQPFYTTSSDHASFARAGVESIMLGGEPMERYHTDMDVPELVSGDAMEWAARLVIATVLELAEEL